MTQSVELAHVYRAELEEGIGTGGWVERLRDDASSVIWDGDPVVLLFVDDYPNVYSAADRENVAGMLIDLAAEQLVPVDAVAFESSCMGCADTLAENLSLDAEGWLVKQGTGHWRATLIREIELGTWTCPALSAIWTLARLGVEPYREAVLGEAVTQTDRFDAETVLTVLPVTYIDNEAAVVEILRQLRKPRIPLSRVQYVFT